MQKLGGVEGDRVGVVLVHVRDDIGLGGDQARRSADVGQERVRLKLYDTSEPADEVGFLGLQLVE